MYKSTVKQLVRRTANIFISCAKKAVVKMNDKKSNSLMMCRAIYLYFLLVKLNPVLKHFLQFFETVVGHYRLLAAALTCRLHVVEKSQHGRRS
jgi:hypothetical protein